jgi:hypothetical protein
MLFVLLIFACIINSAQCADVGLSDLAKRALMLCAQPGCGRSCPEFEQLCTDASKMCIRSAHQKNISFTCCGAALCCLSGLVAATTCSVLYCHYYDVHSKYETLAQLRNRFDGYDTLPVATVNTLCLACLKSTTCCTTNCCLIATGCFSSCDRYLKRWAEKPTTLHME